MSALLPAFLRPGRWRDRPDQDGQADQGGQPDRAARAGLAAEDAAILGRPRGFWRTQGAVAPPSAAALHPRRQLLAAALLAAAAVTATCAAPRLLGAGSPPWAAPIAADAALVAAAIGAGWIPAVRRRSERVLVAAADLACLGGIVVLALAAALALLGHRPDDGGEGFTGPVLIAATVAALGAGPARRRARATVKRAVRGARYAPDDILRSFGEAASRGVDLDEALSLLGDALRRSLSLSRVEIWTGAGGRLTAAVVTPEEPDTDPDRVTVGSTLALSAGDLAVLARTRVAGPGWLALWLPDVARMHPDTQVRVVPARAGGTLLGLLVGCRPQDAPRFSQAEDRLLAELGTRLGTVLHNRQLDANLRDALTDLRRANEDLRVSRARLVAAADAERRRIERDLHDGAQQQLVSLAVGLKLARDIAGEDPEAADEMLAALVDQVSETIAELRNLAHGIYPPLLRSSGLTEALRAAGQRAAAGVTVQADGVGRYSPDIEAAVYFCCLEALQNAAKHAPGSSVEITLAEREASLTFSVSDDGPGFDPRAAARGHGMTNMQDRIGAIGGTLRWESAPGAGTRVIGVVPTGGPDGEGEDAGGAGGAAEGAAQGRDAGGSGAGTGAGAGAGGRNGPTSRNGNGRSGGGSP